MELNTEKLDTERVDTKTFIDEKIKEIKDQVKGKAIVATSGGVDSDTCAVLAKRAIGDMADIVFLDDGLMREGEGEEVKAELAPAGVDLEIVDVAEEFFTALKGLLDPEEKRKAFRNTFYKALGRIVQEREAKYLIQGTIAADISETKRGVKTQHNVLEQIGVDPQTYGLEIVEPLRDLYKPQVRKVAQALDLPQSVYERMPFPGPALMTRVLAEVTPERVEIVRKATSIVEEETRDLKPFQAFAVLFGDKATGLEGEGRAFGDIIAIRSVDSKDALTASVTNVPWEKLNTLQSRITSEIPSVVKVVFDITPKPPSTIEYI